MIVAPMIGIRLSTEMCLVTDSLSCDPAVSVNRVWVLRTIILRDVVAPSQA